MQAKTKKNLLERKSVLKGICRYATEECGDQLKVPVQVWNAESRGPGPGFTGKIVWGWGFLARYKFFSEGFLEPFFYRYLWKSVV